MMSVVFTMAFLLAGQVADAQATHSSPSGFPADATDDIELIQRRVEVDSSFTSASGRSDQLGGNSRTDAATPAAVDPEEAAIAVTTKSEKYVYPDTDSQLTCFLARYRNRMDKVMDCEYDFWVRAQAYLERVVAVDCLTVRSTINNAFRDQYLDVGCGNGRIVAKYGMLFDNAHCLEPDENRIGRARKFLTEDFTWTKGRVHFHNMRFLDWENPTGHGVDAITCIHVIQHIPTEEVRRWLKKMHSLLNAGGVLLLTTTISDPDSTNGEAYYTLGDGSKVSEEKFNEHAATGGAKDGNVLHALGVHEFNSKDLKRMVTEAGFHVQEAGPYMFHRESWKPESQFVVAVREQDKAMFESCAPYDALQAPFTSGMELESLAKLRFIKSRYSSYCGDGVPAVNIKEEMLKTQGRK
mmetsp:Transcript_135411/g.220298  ORF Transcript_135411/g.220298 Transcript_135411/m.220298 type:complete len:410 (+) Transcript_135411:101-1330(+)